MKVSVAIVFILFSFLDPTNLSIIKGEQVPCKAKFVETSYMPVDSNDSQYQNISPVTFDDTYVFGVKNGGWMKMVAVDKAGTVTKVSYMVPDNELNKANWEASTISPYSTNFCNIEITEFCDPTATVTGLENIQKALDGKAGYEYETSPTTSKLKVSFDQCTSCEIIGKSTGLVDNLGSTKVVLKATDSSDIASTNPRMIVDFSYNVAWFTSSFFVTKVDDDTQWDDFEVFARNSDSDAWTQKDVFTQNNNQFIQFKNYEKNKQYRIAMSKQQNKDTMEIKGINLILHLGKTLAAESYYKVTGTKLFVPSSYYAVRGWMLGIIEKPSRNYILQLTVTPKGKVTDWNNILRVRDNPQTTSSVNLGDRNPYFGFPPDSYTANVSVTDKSGTKSLNSVNGFDTNKESKVVIKVIGDTLEAFVDGVSKGSTQALLADRSSYDNFYVFAGQKHTKAAFVLIKDMQWTNVEVE